MMDILPELVSKWMNLNGTDMLQLIYDDPERWSTAQVIQFFFHIFDREHRSRGPRNHFDDSELFLKQALKSTKMFKELL